MQIQIATNYRALDFDLMDNLPAFICLVPAIVALGLAIAFRRSFEALLGGVAVGMLIIEFGRTGEDVEGGVLIRAFNAFVNQLYATFGDPVTVWVILVIGLFGSLIALLNKSGGALAFGKFIGSRVNSKRGALVATASLGVVVFIDDYLNALVVSSSMKRITDRFKISREYLAYVIDSTAAPVCALIPFSTWAVYVSGLLVANNVANAENAIFVFISSIPFNLYAIFALLVLFLTITGFVPIFGPLRKAEKRLEEDGISSDVGDAALISLLQNTVSAVPEQKAKLMNFILPIASLILLSWFLGADPANGVWLGEVKTLEGVMLAILISSVLFLAQRICTFKEFSETFFNGFQSMIYPIGIIVSSFMLVAVNDQLGLTTYIIDSVKPLISGAFLPLVIFLSMSLVAFCTGSFWGMYAVTLPIVIPMAQELDCNQLLAIGSVLSAGVFGSHMCPFGDATVLSAAGSGCNTFQHVITQAPYGILSALLASIGYIVLGFVL
ncbi:MAG: Na+/H+ antiporter NhaC family protein [Sumerlaeia bacterium]